MPYVEVDVDNFLSSCRKADFDAIISFLEDEDMIPPKEKRIEIEKNNEGRTFRHAEFLKALHGISYSYDGMSNDEIDTIIKLGKKYFPM